MGWIAGFAARHLMIMLYEDAFLRPELVKLWKN
jgi:hypothetical protein